mmetsp:Transcript_56942/g.144447  ORF Transcript_56942/g.144447 Transcript_56942/m.144447 type:complete len:247 (+) Transcript_56942:470-1210(+)
MRHVGTSVPEDLRLLRLHQPEQSLVVLDALLLVRLARQTLKPDIPELGLACGDSLLVRHQDLGQCRQGVVRARLRRLVRLLLRRAARLRYQLREAGCGCSCELREGGLARCQRGTVARRLADRGRLVQHILQHLRHELRPMLRHTLAQVIEHVTCDEKSQAVVLPPGIGLDELSDQLQGKIQAFGHECVRVAGHQRADHLAASNAQIHMMLLVLVFLHRLILIAWFSPLSRLHCFAGFQGLFQDLQ